MSGWDEYKKTMVEPESLWLAVKCDDSALLERLLDAGAPIDARDGRGYSPLMLAAYAGNGRLCALLIARGADVNSSDAAGNSVLMGVAFKGDVALARLLIEHGADLGARNHAGLDAREWAERFGRGEVVSLLDGQRAALSAS